ncbi:MAG: flagellar biosynthetic protein FliO [Chloroflexi bacterium]|nr:flagellar biosynthetic protein FliO [Chloroflexota bacterium]
MIPTPSDRYPKWFRQFRQLPWWGQGGVLLAAGVLAALGWAILGGGDLAASTAGQGETIDNPVWLAFTVFLRLGVVVLFILGCALAVRRWKGGPLKSASRRLKVIETLHLSPRRALHLVRVGDREFLIGATDQSIGMLSEIEGMPMPAPEDRAPAASLPFSELLSTAQAHGGTGAQVGELQCR